MVLVANRQRLFHRPFYGLEWMGERQSTDLSVLSSPQKKPRRSRKRMEKITPFLCSSVSHQKFPNPRAKSQTVKKREKFEKKTFLSAWFEHSSQLVFNSLRRVQLFKGHCQ